MSTYFKTGKGWRYEFILQGIRYTKAWFKTKREAKEAEANRREEIQNPKPEIQTPTDMAFLDLVNMRLDYVKAYHSGSYYSSYKSMAQRWVKAWRNLNCGDKCPTIKTYNNSL